MSFITSPSSTGYVSTGDASCASTGNTLLSPIACGNLLSTILGRVSSHVTGSDLLSAVFGTLLSFIASSRFLSAVFGCFLTLITSNNLLSTVSDEDFLSLMPFAGSYVLFPTSTLSCVYRFSLPFLPLFHFFFAFFVYTTYP